MLRCFSVLFIQPFCFANRVPIAVAAVVSYANERVKGSGSGNHSALMYTIVFHVGSDSGDVEHYETPSAATDFSQVVALRIAILTRDFSGTTLDPDKRTYGLLDSDPVTYEDQVARYVQTGTIWFPNKKAI